MTSLEDWLKDWQDWNLDHLKTTCQPGQATLAEPEQPPWNDAKPSSDKEEPES